MKRLLPMMLVCMISVGLMGCASDAQRAQNTAQAFLDAMRREDRLAVKETVTTKAWATLSSWNESKEKKEQPDYTIGQATITDNTAQVAVTAREDGKETPLSVKLRREEKEWRVYAMTYPVGGSELTLDFEHPETLAGESFRAMGEALGAMLKGVGEGLGAMVKGMSEGFQKASQSAPR